MLRRVISIPSSSSSSHHCAIPCVFSLSRHFHSRSDAENTSSSNSGDLPHRALRPSKPKRGSGKKTTTTTTATLAPALGESHGAPFDWEAAATATTALAERSEQSTLVKPSPVSDRSLQQSSSFEAPTTSTSSSFMANADSRRRQRKPTMEQLEFPSGITERIDAHSGSRIQALYQLHYADTLAREIDCSSGAPVVLEPMTSAQYRAARDFLDAEAEGKIPDKNPMPTKKQQDDDTGFVFTLYLENTPTESFLHTISARFGVPRRSFDVHHLFSKDQCTTQRVFVSSSAVSSEARLFSINLMRFPGFCARVSSVTEGGGVPRAEFRKRQRTTTEVTTLLRRVQVDGSGAAIRSVFNTMRRTGVVNYLGTVNQSHLRAFRWLQKASFKAALLSWLDHPNMRPELAAFLQRPAQQTASAARRVVTNPVTAGLLRTYSDTQSFYRAVEWAPANARQQLYRMARRFAWNLLASKRVRLVADGKKADDAAAAEDEDGSVEMDTAKMMKNLKPRRGDFVVVENSSSNNNSNNNNSYTTIFSLAGGNVKLLESDEEAASFTPFDILIPIPAPGVLDRLPGTAAAAQMRATLQRMGLLGLVEVPAAYSENPAQWQMLTTVHGFVNSSSSSSSSKSNKDESANVAKEEEDILFRRLLLPVTDEILGHTAATKDDDDADFSSSRGVCVSVDPTPSGHVYDSRRILLNDRLLAQRQQMIKKRKGQDEEQQQQQQRLLNDITLVSKTVPDLDEQDPTMREVLNLPEQSPFADVVRRKKASGEEEDERDSGAAVQLEWARSTGGGPGRSSKDSFEPALPISDTSRLTSVVTCAVTMRNVDPAQVPMILREHFSLHGVLCEPDAQLQHAVHAQLRTCDREASAAWAQSFCEICYSIKHSRSSECPLHQRRIALRVAEAQRTKMEKASSSGTASASVAAASSSTSASSRREAEPEGKSTKKQQQKQEDDDDDTGDDADILVVAVARDVASRKWGIRVSASLQLAAGTEQAQPSLAPFIGTHRVQRVGPAPVATVEQLKIALAAAEDGKSSLTLVQC